MFHSSDANADYLALRRNWNYFNIWWNAADFALCLARLLVDAAAAQTCCRITRRLDRLRWDEVILPRDRGCQTTLEAGIAGFVCGWAACCGVALIGAAMPVALPVVMVGGWTCAVGSVVTSGALQEGGGARQRHRDQAIAALQESFPELNGLFAQSSQDP
jgi:hypothetical protein